LSTAETACHSTPEEAGLRVETEFHSSIPQQTRLFLDYLRDRIPCDASIEAVRVSLRKFPSGVTAFSPITKTDRAAVCDALEQMIAAGVASGEPSTNSVVAGH